MRALFRTPGPAAAVVIAPERVTAVQIAWRGTTPAVRGHAQAALPAGAVTPAVHGPNVADAPTVARAVDEVLDGLPRRPRRVALLLPDGAAKVSLARFASVPRRAADLDGMIRWQVRDTVPFDLDEAQVDWRPGRLTADGEQEFVVVLAERAVVEEYEQVCTAADAHAGLVDLAGFSLLDTAIARGAGADGADWLLVRVGAGSGTVAVVRGRCPLAFRTAAADAGTLGDLVHRTLMYHEDRLGGGGFARALVAGAGDTPAGAGAVRRVLEDRCAVVEPLAAQVAPWAAERIDPAALDGVAGAIGVLLRESGIVST